MNNLVSRLKNQEVQEIKPNNAAAIKLMKTKFFK
jgi:hypothetical protein